MNVTTHFGIGDSVYVVLENVFVERVDGFTTCFINKGKPVTVNSVTTMNFKNRGDSDELIQREVYTFEGFHPMSFMGIIIADKCNIFASREEAIVAFPELGKKMEERTIITSEQVQRMMEASVDMPTSEQSATDAVENGDPADVSEIRARDEGSESDDDGGANVVSDVTTTTPQ